MQAQYRLIWRLFEEYVIFLYRSHDGYMEHGDPVAFMTAEEIGQVLGGN